MQVAELAADVSRLNHPVVDLANALKPDVIAEYLSYEFTEHTERARELAAAFARFLAATANGINDDATTGRATDFAKVHKAELAAIDDTRTRIKAPVLVAQRLIDSAGKNLADPLKANVAVIEQRIAVYLQRKAEQARRDAEAEAQRLAAAAHEAMRLVDIAPEPDGEQAAMKAIQAAQEAEALANAPTPELSRTRSLNGALAGLRQTWTYEVTDLAKIPAQWLCLNEPLVKAAIKTGTREIPGLRIYAEHKAFVR